MDAEVGSVYLCSGVEGDWSSECRAGKFCIVAVSDTTAGNRWPFFMCQSCGRVQYAGGNCHSDQVKFISTLTVHGPYGIQLQYCMYFSFFTELILYVVRCLFQSFVFTLCAHHLYFGQLWYGSESRNKQLCSVPVFTSHIANQWVAPISGHIERRSSMDSTGVPYCTVRP